ncbi:MAG: hypothetical protein NXI30_16690 [bacterium]|nr:hypothetical protein [bacterium]
MRISRRDKSSPYEVRCPRCDVSFPVETRTCIHCGGPTSDQGAFLTMEDPAEFATSAAPGDYTISSSAPESRTSSADTPFGVFDEAGIFKDDSRSEPVNDRAYQEEAEAPGFVQMLLRSAGSFIWILLLIAFSLSRSCEN